MPLLDVPPHHLAQYPLRRASAARRQWNGQVLVSSEAEPLLIHFSSYRNLPFRHSRRQGSHRRPTSSVLPARTSSLQPTLTFSPPLDLINATICISVLSIGLSCVYAGSRVLTALAETGFAPRCFITVDKSGRPLWSVVFVLAWGLVRRPPSCLTPRRLTALLPARLHQLGQLGRDDLYLVDGHHGTCDAHQLV